MNSLSDKHIGRLLLVIISIVVALVSAEILFRICIYFSLIRYPKPDYSRIVHEYSENKELVYELKSSFFSEREGYVTNKYGMRDYDYSLKKSSNTIIMGVESFNDVDLIDLMTSLARLLV